MHLDHVTIRTHELEATRNFMVEVFGLVEGSRPASIVASVEGYWLYEKDWPLIHLIKSNMPPGHSHESAEAIDHFAFVMEDYRGFEQKLIRLGISYQKMHIPEMRRKRIFLHTPFGILIETIFEENENSHRS